MATDISLALPGLTCWLAQRVNRCMAKPVSFEGGYMHSGARAAETCIGVKSNGWTSRGAGRAWAFPEWASVPIQGGCHGQVVQVICV